MPNRHYNKQAAQPIKGGGREPALPGGPTVKASKMTSTGYKGKQTRVYPEKSGHFGKFELR